MNGYCKNIMKRYIVKTSTAFLVSLCLSSCVNDNWVNESSDNRINFSASLNHVSSRITGTSWDGDETVGISLNDDNKNYKTYNVDKTGKLTTTQGEFVWDGNEFTVNAWCPAVSDAISLVDQTTESKFYDCDLLACDITANSNNVNLTFGHKMTRMWWMLQTTTGYTTEQVNAAKVYFYGYSSVNFNNGVLSAVGEPNQLISTFDTGEGNSRTGEAFMVPCEMWEKPLIRVEIGGDNFVYTPRKSDNDDNSRNRGTLLENTHQKYYINVSPKGLSVNVVTENIDWGNQIVPGGSIVNAKFRVSLNEQLADLEIAGVTDSYIDSNSFSVSYTENAYGGLSCEGVCDIQRTVSGNTHTYTFTNIASDIILTYTDEHVEVGDYYYSDGTWGSSPVKDGVTTLGRVFKVGVDDTDNVSYYDEKLSKIRGYVVCDPSYITSDYKWITTSDGVYKDLLDTLDGLTDADRENISDYFGYKLTKGIGTALEQFVSENDGQTMETEFPLYYFFKNQISLSAPEATSGWYIPSVAQLQDINSANIYEGFSGKYWSSNVYVERGVNVINRVWALDYNTSEDKEGTCWASDDRKLILILTF